MRHASMPMYDMPEVRAALDALWDGLARNLRREGVADVPDTLLHDRPLAALWADPDLLFSQCCGYDIVNRCAGTLRPIATPHYDAPECDGGDYASVIVVAEDVAATDISDMRGAVCAVNGFESHSGMNALRALVAPLSENGRFFSTVKVSGTHAGSLEMIGRGEADVTAIDCVSYALIKRYRPGVLAGTRKLGESYRGPAIPYVTRSSEDEDTVARMRTALMHTFADPNLAAVRDALLLKDVEALPESAYGRIAEFQTFAARHGYAELR